MAGSGLVSRGKLWRGLVRYGRQGFGGVWYGVVFTTRGALNEKQLKSGS